MISVGNKINSSLSVDCVIFGFDSKALKVLVVERQPYEESNDSFVNLKLPGRMIFENESLEFSAAKILEEMTGLTKIKLQQVQIFSDPSRLSPDEMRWINEYHGIYTDRVVTVAYYGLVKLSPHIVSEVIARHAYWIKVDEIKQLAMDHKAILSAALTRLCSDIRYSPIAFDLLPKKFTLRQLQTLFEAVLGIEIDNRNFRKKMLSVSVLHPTGEREKGVAHKPAEFYTFRRSVFERRQKERFKLGFIDNWI